MAQATTSLQRRGSVLSDPRYQLNVLRGASTPSAVAPPFPSINTAVPTVLQVNIGKMCNQACTHCHVDAGPDRVEMMSRKTMEECLQALDVLGIRTLDITGGAPEMHPDFRWFVDEAIARGAKVMVRCNLTIIVSNPKYLDLPQFYAERNVHVISSLPCYTQDNVDRQRGAGAYRDSIEALKRLNAAGYGKSSTGLLLDLVYNPGGASLPGPQAALREDYAKVLFEEHGIVFNNLHCMTNMPISRFLEDLIESGRYRSYMELLVEKYNPHALDGVMCRNAVSVGYDGVLYDCDFNQMLDMPVSGTVRHIADVSGFVMEGRPIVTAPHCYGCTAGAGSSCGGQLA